MGKPASTQNSSPFQATPDPRQYVAVGSMELARKRIMRAIDRQEGPAVLIGPTGTGKTLLCQVLADSYRSTLDVVLLADAQICTRRALLQSILSQMGLPYKQMEEGELRLSLLDRLRPGPNDKVKGGVLIIVDEADSYPTRLIDELRMIGGVVRDGRPRVRLVFAGNMRFEEKLAAPSMESLTQRIAARCYLHPMQISETREYLREHFRRTGLTLEGLLTEDALQAIQQVTDGIPRVINQLMDQAILTAHQRGEQTITLPVVEEAWADIHQLPPPFCDSPTSTRATSAYDIEFGALDEIESEDSSAPMPVLPKSEVSQSRPQEPSVNRLPTPEVSSPKTKVNSPNMSSPQASNPVVRGPEVSSTNATTADRLAVFAGNNRAIAFSHFEDSSFKSVASCDAASFFAGSGTEPWSFTQAAILDERSLPPPRSKVAPAAQPPSPSSTPGPKSPQPLDVPQPSTSIPSVSMPSASMPSTQPPSPSSAPAPKSQQSPEVPQPSVSIPSVSMPTVSMPTTQPPSPRQTSHTPVSTDAAEKDAFGDDFDEVIDLRRPVRISTSGPLPWKGEMVKEAKWLQELETASPDVLGPELKVHREILEIHGDAEQSLRPAAPSAAPSMVEEIEAVEVVEELPMVDDRDMLITIEDVPMASEKQTVVREAKHLDLDYRSIFSRLRNG